MSDEIQHDSFPYSEETYSKGLNREDTLEGQIRCIVKNYSDMNWSGFEYSLKALYPLLPTKLVKEYNLKPLKHDVTVAGVERHFEEFMKIQELIETKSNMIWKKKFIRTYQ